MGAERPVAARAKRIFARRVHAVWTSALLALAGPMVTAQSPGLRPALRPGRNAAPRFSIEMMRRTCPSFSDITPGREPDDLRDCAVSQFGEFAAFDGRTYYYAIYCLIPNDADKSACNDKTRTAENFRARGLAIFTRDRASDTATLLLERASRDLGIYVFPQKPAIVDSSLGAVLYVPMTVDGTGSGNASEYYAWDSGEWKPIEAETWLGDLQRRLPQGLEIRKGVWPDLRTMSAETGLYRPGDANCCPSGGVVRVRLSILSRRFVIDSFVVAPQK